MKLCLECDVISDFSDYRIDYHHLFEAAKANQKNSKTFYEFPDIIEILLKFCFHGKSAEEILKITFAPKALLFDRFVGEYGVLVIIWTA